MARILALYALSLSLFCSICIAQGAVFGSTQSGTFSDAETWSIIEGEDEDGVPDGDDSLTINSGHHVDYLGQATAPIIHDMLIEQSGSFSITRSDKQIFWTTGKLTVRGLFEIIGPHQLYFDGDESYQTGIHVVEGGALNMTGVDVLNESVSQFRPLGNHLAEITLSLPSIEPNALVGKRLKLLDGRASNHVFPIVGNTESAITIRMSASETPDPFESHLRFRPISILRDRIVFSRDDIDLSRFTHRSGHAKEYVGQWVRFSFSGNAYLIIGVEQNGQTSTFFLEGQIAAEDLDDTFHVEAGIAEGDSFVIYDPVVATIPENKRDDGLGHAMLVAYRADVALTYAKFDYFGSHIGYRGRVGGWQRSTAGLSFVQSHSLRINFCEFYQTSAASQILVEGASQLNLTRNIVGDVHEAINPDGELEVGHGWVFQRVNGLVFNQNIVMNMNDDLVYVSRDSTNLTFTNNKLINTPIWNGSSANNLEIVTNMANASVYIEDNIMINADVNLNVEFRNGGIAEIYDNIIASTLRWRSSNVVLRNVNGTFSGNSMSHAPTGVVLMGDTNVNIRPNSYSHHILSVIDRSEVQRNAWISLGILALGFLLVSRARQRYFKWVVRAIYAGLVVVNLATIYVSYFLM